jgi:hypothetical protein
MSQTNEVDTPPGGDAPGAAALVDDRTLPARMADTLADLVDAVVMTDRIIAAAFALRAGVIDQVRLWSEISENAAALTLERPTGPGWNARTVARRVVAAELACALRIPERTMENLLEQSRALLHELPATMDALNAGEISYRHAEKMIDHAGSVPAEARETFEAALLPQAKRLTVSKFDAKARIMREREHPDTITARHLASVLDRNVQVQPDQDGMAWLHAFLPAHQVSGIMDRLTRMGLTLHTPAEPRTLTQVKADVFSDLLIDGVTQARVGRGIRAKVMVTVPVLTLLGRSEAPGCLEGFGPIDPDTARELSANAPSFRRLLTHPETGCVLSVGRDSYTVPKDLKDWLRVRDETCRFPGCQRAATGCDLDHSTDWFCQGETAHDNLAHLCRKHHRLKHNTPWTVTHTGGGILTWTSPAGRTYTTETETTLEPPPPF